MKKLKVRIGITTVLVSVMTLSVLPVDKNIKDITSKGDMKEVLSLVKINDTMVSIAQIKDEEALDDKVKNKNFDENIEDLIIDEDIIVVQETSEDNIPEIKKVHEEDKRVPTPSRGGEVRVNKPIPEKLDNNLNKYVLDVIKTYSLEGGKYPYLLNNDFQNYNGVTENLYYKGELLLKANPNGNKASHCTGITFEVFFKAMQQRNKSFGIPVDDFNGMSKEQLMDFVLDWYVAQGPKSQSNLSVAIEKYGLGTKITNLEALRPGDFIDLSRENNTGHTAIFQNWIREGDRIIGLKYWSSQGSTNGINYKEEYFNIKDKKGNKYGNVIIDQMYMARISPINEYKKSF
jgi:hypothetical protein